MEWNFVVEAVGHLASALIVRRLLALMGGEAWHVARLGYPALVRGGSDREEGTLAATVDPPAWR
jgi:hypothetical protein